MAIRSDAEVTFRDEAMPLRKLQEEAIAVLQEAIALLQPTGTDTEHEIKRQQWAFVDQHLRPLLNRIKHDIELSDGIDRVFASRPMALRLYEASVAAREAVHVLRKQLEAWPKLHGPRVETYEEAQQRANFILKTIEKESKDHDDSQ